MSSREFAGSSSRMPMVSQAIIDVLRGNFSDSVMSIDTHEDLIRAKGQQDVIDYLQAHADKQTE